MEASDAQVASLRTKLLDAVRQKRQVLGEASSTEIVAGGADGGGWWLFIGGFRLSGW